MSYKNDLLLRTINGEKTERTPVWLMRQAGRILPEYREVRSSVKNFVELVSNPQLAAEVTVQPVDLLDVDAAIIFSDILVIPESMGLPYDLIEKRGPVFPETIKSKADVQKLRVSDPEETLGYVKEAILETKKRLDNRVPLIGFAGAPWTIFCYMIEGMGSKTFSKPRGMLYSDPALSHELLQMITDATISYLKMQIAAGADLVQLFDSWAGVLSPAAYKTFSLPYLKQIADEIQEVPKTMFAKDAWHAVEDLGKLDVQTVGLDWCVEPAYARNLVPEKVLQGNLDPAILYGSDQDIEAETVKMLKAFGPGKHIANLGHGVYPDIDPDKVRVFIQTVKNQLY